MNAQPHNDDSIRILIADDDERILACYREAFGGGKPHTETQELYALGDELFKPDSAIEEKPKFELVACKQGDDAIDIARQAATEGHPFDVVILDVRMPPGIDGVEAGCRIRQFDEDIEIVFVTGYSDVPREELERRVPPPGRLHCYSKPLSFMKLADDVASIVKAH
jgi:CheY-like chemotaxis protein